MRTQDEIAQRIKDIDGEDIFGFGREALLDLLDFEHARPFLKDGVTAEQWALLVTPIEAMKDYIAFAWEKVQDHRGLSAGRSIAKFIEWLWAEGDDGLVAYANGEGHYPQYGAPILRRICEKYNLPMPTGEAWFENMSTGQSCRPSCNEGCGR